MIVPEDRVFYLDLSVEEGLKTLMSAGIVLPENKDVYQIFKEYIQKK